MTELVDRYVEATLRRLPSRQRPDLDKELRASIADAVDDRVEAGEDPAEAEVAVLTGLGDPARLAAGYSDRPLQLIGPALYLDYLRLLTALLITVVPAAAMTVGLLRGLDGGSALSVLGDALGAALTAALHVAVWTTLIFAVIDRTVRPRRTAWTPAAMPARRIGHGELITLTVLMVLVVTLMLVSPWFLKSAALYTLIALVIVSSGFTYARQYLPWSVPLELTGSLVDLACPILMIWLAATGRLLLAGPQWINTALIVISIITIVSTVGQGISRAVKE